MKLLVILLTFNLIRAQTLLDCATAASNIGNCLIGNLVDCQEGCSVPDAPGSDGVGCDEATFCQAVQDDCCEFCRVFVVDYLNTCGSCSNTFECTFAPTTRAPSPPMTPCEQAALDTTACPFSTENVEVCQGTVCAVAGSPLIPPFVCSDLKATWCEAGREACCEPCRGTWDRYVDECIFKNLPLEQDCSCSSSPPAPPTAPVPTSTVMPIAEPTTVTTTPTMLPTPVPQDGTGPPLTTPPNTDSPARAPAPSPPTRDELAECQNEQEQFETCSQDCQQCEDQFEKFQGFPTCSEFQETCAIARTCCPQCVSTYSNLMNCVFQQPAGQSCSCNGGGTGSGATSYVGGYAYGLLAVLGLAI